MVRIAPVRPVLRARRRRLLVLPAIVFALVLGGCGAFGGDDDEDATPAATSPKQYAQRMLPYLKRMNRNLEVINLLRSPEIEIALAGQNPTTYRILNKTLDDLEACSDRLGVVGEPPADAAELIRAHNAFGQACEQYEEAAPLLREGIPLKYSPEPADRPKGIDTVAESADPLRLGSERFQGALEILAKTKVMESVGFDLAPGGT